MFSRWIPTNITSARGTLHCLIDTHSLRGSARDLWTVLGACQEHTHLLRKRTNECRPTFASVHQRSGIISVLTMRCREAETIFIGPLPLVANSPRSTCQMGKLKCNTLLHCRVRTCSHSL
jgi:hypothetical protein